MRPSSLQVLSCLLQEQRLVFFSADWARLTLVTESLLLYLQVSAKGTLCLPTAVILLYCEDMFEKLSAAFPYLSSLLLTSSSLCRGSSPTFPSCREECWTFSWRLQPSWWAVTSVILKRSLQWVHLFTVSVQATYNIKKVLALWLTANLASLTFLCQDDGSHVRCSSLHTRGQIMDLLNCCLLDGDNCCTHDRLTNILSTSSNNVFIISQILFVSWPCGWQLIYHKYCLSHKW